MAVSRTNSHFAVTLIHEKTTVSAISKASSTEQRDSVCKVKVRIRLALKLLKLEEPAEESTKEKVKKRESEEKTSQDSDEFATENTSKFCVS